MMNSYRIIFYSHGSKHFDDLIFPHKIGVTQWPVCRKIPCTHLKKFPSAMLLYTYRHHFTSTGMSHSLPLSISYIVSTSHCYLFYLRFILMVNDDELYIYTRFCSGNEKIKNYFFPKCLNNMQTKNYHVNVKSKMTGATGNCLHYLGFITTVIIIWRNHKIVFYHVRSHDAV